MNVEYPRFETRVFAELPEVAELVSQLPTVHRVLFEEGIPKRFLFRRYTADPELAILAWEGHAPVVRFGTSDLSEAIGVDVSTGHVIEVVDVPWRPTNLVNTTIEIFTRTIQALMNRFPYYSKYAEYDQIDSACEELREIIRSIDPQASAPDTLNRHWWEREQHGKGGGGSGTIPASDAYEPEEGYGNGLILRPSIPPSVRFHHITILDPPVKIAQFMAYEDRLAAYSAHLTVPMACHS